MPALLPSSPDALIDGLQFFMHFWLPDSYFVPRALAKPHSRLRYVHMWFEDMLATTLIHHNATRTLVGGHNGTVWVARAIISLILNFSAINGEFSPPVDQPKIFDITQFPQDEYTNVLGWGQQLLEAIQSSTEILARTSTTRQAEDLALVQQLELDDTQSQEPAAIPRRRPIPSPTPTAPVPRPQRNHASSATGSHSRRARRQKRHGGHNSHSDETNSGDSDTSTVNQDYDTLDRNPNDNDDLNPDGFSLEVTETALSEDEPGVTRSSPHLGDECFDVFKPRTYCVLSLIS
jgi:hypothetical protein